MWERPKAHLWPSAVNCLTSRLLGRLCLSIHLIIWPFAIALSRDSEVWFTQGAPAFAAMMESVQFQPSAAGETGDNSEATSLCTISTDTTYGYTETNAILVGGDAFGGPPRERAFLDNLLGPNGEPVSYERIGSLPFNDTILDIYELTVGGKSVTLFVDEYN